MGLSQPVSQNLNLGLILSKLRNLKRRIILQGGNLFREKENWQVFPPKKRGFGRERRKEAGELNVGKCSLTRK